MTQVFQRVFASFALLWLSGCTLPSHSGCPAMPAEAGPNSWTVKVEATICQRDLLGPVSLSNMNAHGQADQALRSILSQIEAIPAPTENATAARAAILADMAGDEERGAQVLAIKPAGRWFSATELDPQGHQAAFLLVQHSNPDIMTAILPDLRTAAMDGLVSKEAVAMMTDRVLVADGQLQEYGTQGSCTNGQLGLPPVRDPETVDARRAAMGIDMPLAEYQALMLRHMRC
jgi:hypothetical protein